MALAAIRKPKKNLLQPFKLWNLHGNAKLIGDNEVELNATAGYQTSIYAIPSEPLKTYTLSMPIVANQRFDIVAYNKANVVLFTFVMHVTNLLTFTTPTDTARLNINIGSASAGKFNFKDPMLVEGGTAQPFEPYVEVNPPAVKASKNLINPLEKVYRYGDGAVALSSDYSVKIVIHTGELALFVVPVKPNTTYTVKGICNQAGGTRVIAYPAKPTTETVATGGTVVFNDINIATAQTFTTGTTTRYVGVGAYGGGQTSNVGLVINELQLEEGITATPFEPYKEVNRKSARVENIFDMAMEPGYFNPFGVGTPMVSATHKRNINFMPIKPLTNYVLISNKINNFYIHFYDGSKNFISSFQSIGKITVVYDSTNTPANARHVKFHFDDTGNSGVNYQMHQFYEENKFISSPSWNIKQAKR